MSAQTFQDGEEDQEARAHPAEDGGDVKNPDAAEQLQQHEHAAQDRRYDAKEVRSAYAPPLQGEVARQAPKQPACAVEDGDEGDKDVLEVLVAAPRDINLRYVVDDDQPATTRHQEGEELEPEGDGGQLKW